MGEIYLSYLPAGSIKGQNLCKEFLGGGLRPADIKSTIPGYSESVTVRIMNVLFPVFQCFNPKSSPPSLKTLLGCDLEGTGMFTCPPLTSMGTAVFAAWPKMLALAQLLGSSESHPRIRCNLLVGALLT